MSDGKSVLIVGAGIAGLSAAYYALRMGHRVTVADRGGPGGDACSLGNAGMVVPSHIVPLAAPGMVAKGLRAMLNPEGPFTIRPRLDLDLLRWCWRFWRSARPDHVDRAGPLLRDLGLESRRLYEELAAEAGNAFGLEKKGLLMLCRSEGTLREETELAGRARALGMPADVMGPAEAAGVEPGLKMDIAGAVYFPLDCHLDPRKLLAWLRAALERGGVRFIWNAEVARFVEERGRIAAAVTARDERLEADEFVLAAGAWSPGILGGLRARILLQAGKGYSVDLPAPRRLPGPCAILVEARVAVTPMGSSLRLAGTMEIGGLDRSVHLGRLRGFLGSIPRYYPEFVPDDFRGLPAWSGLRPCSPDGLPYVGRLAGHPNLILATGHAMLGLSLGPVTGKLVAEIISGEPPSIGIGLLDPDRHGRRRS